MITQISEKTIKFKLKKIFFFNLICGLPLISKSDPYNVVRYKIRSIKEVECRIQSLPLAVT